MHKHIEVWWATNTTKWHAVCMVNVKHEHVEHAHSSLLQPHDIPSWSVMPVSRQNWNACKVHYCVQNNKHWWGKLRSTSMSSVNIKKRTPSTAMYVMMTPIPGRSNERTLSTKRIGLDGSSQNLRWMGENNTEWLHARTSMLIFHGSISTIADDLLHGLCTCCTYILWDLVDVNVIETNSQPVDKRLLVQCKVYEWIAYKFKWPLSDESEITVVIVQKWTKHAN